MCSAYTEHHQHGVGRYICWRREVVMVSFTNSSTSISCLGWTPLGHNTSGACSSGHLDPDHTSQPPSNQIGWSCPALSVLLLDKPLAGAFDAVVGNAS